jgi:hypothetical protein
LAAARNPFVTAAVTAKAHNGDRDPRHMASI